MAPPPHRWVVLSPHLDDAALSLGGQIAEKVWRGDRVVIVTVFAGGPPPGELSPLARRLHRSWGAENDLMARRRREDEEGCRQLGAELVHWLLPDAIYRRSAIDGPHLYPTFEALTGTPSGEDDALAVEIARRLADLPEHDDLLVPLGVGSHVDHLLVRRAAEQRFGPEHLVYYEEYPYLEAPDALERAMGSSEDWHRMATPVGPAAARAKTAAVLAHRSQMRSLFRGSLLARLRLWWFWRRTGVERTWTRRPRQAPEDSRFDSARR